MKPIIAIPAYNGCVMGAVVPSLIQCFINGIDSTITEGQSLICRERSRIATQLKDSYTHIIWIDADVVFTARDVVRVLQLSVEHNAIVSGYYPKRIKREGWALSIARPGMGLLEFNNSQPPIGTVEIEACGFGFVVTPTWVFGAIEKRFGFNEVEGICPYFIPQLSEGRYVGEDYSFCSRARELPCVILAATDVVLKHRGNHDFSSEDTGGPLPTTWEEQRYHEDRWFEGRDRETIPAAVSGEAAEE